MTLAPSSRDTPIPEEGVVSGGGGGGGVGVGSNEGMGDAPDVEDAGGEAGSHNVSESGGKKGGKDEEKVGGKVGKGKGGRESKISAQARGYDDVRKFHPAWEGFGKGPSGVEGRDMEWAKL